MAQFSIRSASKALSATTGNDTINIGGVGSTNLSAQTVLGADGNDIIDIGTVGLTATLTAIVNIGTGVGASGGSALVTGIVGGPGGSQFTAVVTATGGAGDTAATGVATGILTADAGITTASKLQLKGQAGHDTVVFGSALSTLTAAFIGGGQGNDYIGGGSFINDEYTAGSGSLSDAKLINTTIFGGKGQDTINLEGNAVFSAGKVNGYEDDDTLKFQNGSATNYFIGGGKGNDTISGDFNKLYTSSIVGGQGQDSLILSDIGSAVGVQIAADSLDRSDTTANGNDSIYISGALRTSTVLGGAGNDSLTIALSAASGNTIYLDGGNDLVSATNGTDITDSTFYFGAGDDKFVLADTGEVNSGTKLIMGAGADTVTLSAMAMETSTLAGLTIEGGAGADQFIIDSGLAASGAYTIIGGAGADRASGDGYVGAGTTGAIFFLNTATESQLGTMDEINVVSESGDNLRVGFSADRSLTSFSGGITGTDGLVAGSGILIASGIAVFSGGLMNAANGNTATITSVTNVLDAALDTVGESTLFTLTGNIANAGNSGVYYIFTQGGATDFLVEVETHSGTLGALQVNTGLTTNTLLVSGG